MSFIAKNPLIIPEVESPSSAPMPGTRGLFAGKDGLYEIDDEGVSKKIITSLDTKYYTDFISGHDISEVSHKDIRDVIKTLSDKIEALDLDDETLAQILEIEKYINSNADLIETMTSDKIRYSDIVTDPSIMATEDNRSVLSAYYGKLLNNNKIDTDKIITNISNTSYGDKDQVLSSHCGRQLYDDKLDKSSVVADPYVSWDDSLALSASYGRYLNDYKIDTHKVVKDPYSAPDDTYVLSVSYGKTLDTTKAKQEDFKELQEDFKELSDRVGEISQSIPTKISKLTNDAGYIQDRSYVHTDNNFTNEYKEKIDTFESEGITNSIDNTIYNWQSGALEADKIYKMSISKEIQFIPPLITDGKFHQILIFANISDSPAISYGTNIYFNGEIPTVTNGNCDIIFEYDGSEWAAGVITKEQVV